MAPQDKQILRIALPSIVSNITVPLLGLVDVAITGHLGSASYIGAIAVGGMLFNIIYWMFAFLRMGTSGMTAQALGAKHLDEVLSHLLRSSLIALGLSAILLILQVPICKIALNLISPEPAVRDYAKVYFDICIWGAPPSLLLFALNGWYIGMQNTRIPMVIAIVQNIANILISLILVFVFSFKIEGVAVGTVLAQYIGFLIAISFIYHYYLPKLRKYLVKGKVTDCRSLSRFFSVNRDIFLRTLCLIAVHFFFVSAGAHFGSTILAVNALLMQLFTLYSYIMDGFAYAGEALVGKAVGARNQASYDNVVHRLFIWGTLMAVSFTLLYAALGHPFLCLLTNETSVLQEAQHYWAWVLLFPICGMGAFIWDGIFIGATRTRFMLTAVFGSMLTFFLLYHLLKTTIGPHALWLAFVCYLFMRGAISYICQKSCQHRQQDLSKLYKS